MAAMVRSICCSFLGCIIIVSGSYADQDISLRTKRILAGSGMGYLKLQDERYSPVTYRSYIVPISLGYQIRRGGTEIDLGIQFIPPHSLSSQSEKEWHDHVTKPADRLWQLRYLGELKRVMGKFPGERLRPKAGIGLEMEPLSMSSEFVYLRKFASLYISLEAEYLMTSRNVFYFQAGTPVVSYLERINYSMSDVDCRFSSLRNSRGIVAEIGYERTLTHFLHLDFSYCFSYYTYRKDTIGLKEACDRLTLDIVIVLGGTRG